MLVIVDKNSFQLNQGVKGYGSKIGRIPYTYTLYGETLRKTVSINHRFEDKEIITNINTIMIVKNISVFFMLIPSTKFLH